MPLPPGHKGPITEDISMGNLMISTQLTLDGVMTVIIR